MYNKTNKIDIKNPKHNNFCFKRTLCSEYGFGKRFKELYIYVNPVEDYCFYQVKIMQYKKETFSSYNIPGMNTGSGSGSGNDWQYEFRIYLQDFPHLEEDFNTRHLLGRAKHFLTSNYGYKIEESYEL